MLITWCVRRASAALSALFLFAIWISTANVLLWNLFFVAAAKTQSIALDQALTMASF